MANKNKDAQDGFLILLFVVIWGLFLYFTKSDRQASGSKQETEINTPKQ